MQTDAKILIVQVQQTFNTVNIIYELTENLPLIIGGSYTEYDGEEEILYFQCDDPSKTAIPSDDREGKTKEYGQILIDNIQKPFCEGKKTCQQR